SSELPDARLGPRSSYLIADRSEDDKNFVGQDQLIGSKRSVGPSRMRVLPAELAPSLPHAAACPFAIELTGGPARLAKLGQVCAVLAEGSELVGNVAICPQCQRPRY